MKRVYLDHSATTPLDSRVKEAMEPFWDFNFGNAGGLYEEGRRAKDAIENSRQKIAKMIGARSDEIIFTSGGTESDNLAIFGIAEVVLSLRQQTLQDADIFLLKNSSCSPQSGSQGLAMSAASAILEKKPHIITTKFEHHAVLEPCQRLEKEGFDVTYLDVGKDGIVDPEGVRNALRPETVLVSIMYANNEIGTIQPITEISKIIKEYRMSKAQASQDLAQTDGASRAIPQQRDMRVLAKLGAKTSRKQYPYFHTDACQAAGYLDLNVNNLGIDLMTVNGSKIYGPKGVGFLYKKTGVKIKPQIIGGGQEMRMRSGTEAVPLFVGLAEALEIAQLERNVEAARLSSLRDYFISEILKRVPKVVLNGHMTKRLPNNVNVSILDIEGEALILYLDAKGIACSTGSACTSESLDPSHVILALGKPYEFAHSSMRFTMGRATTKDDLDYVLDVLPKTVEWLRTVSPLNIDPNALSMSHPEAFAGENLKVKAKSQSYK